MALSTFADLKSTVATFLNRSNLTTQIPYFVQLCETRIFYGSEEQPFASEPLRIRAMESSQYATFNVQTIALPSNFLQQRRLYIASTPNIRVEYIAPDLFWDKWLSSTTGRPSQFTVEGENIVLGPTPDSAYTGQLLFYKKFDALSGDTDTNWLLANAFGAYLHGTLCEAYRFIRNNEQAQVEYNSFVGIINSLNNANKADRYATPWTARSDNWTP